MLGIVSRRPVSVAARHLFGQGSLATPLRYRAVCHAHTSITKQQHSADMGSVDGVFSMGPGTLQIDRRQFHETIRHNVVKRMQENLEDAKRGVAVLQVGTSVAL
jgi:hypothetical protein